MAAHLLACHYREIIPIQLNSEHLSSDSQDVLYWLRDHPSRWQTFIANRNSDFVT